MVKMRSNQISWALSPVTDVLIRRPYEDTQTHKKKAVRRGEWNDTTRNDQKYQQPRTWKGPWSPHHLLTPELQILASKTVREHISTV